MDCKRSCVLLEESVPFSCPSPLLCRPVPQRPPRRGALLCVCGGSRDPPAAPSPARAGGRRRVRSRGWMGGGALLAGLGAGGGCLGAQTAVGFVSLVCGVRACPCRPAVRLPDGEARRGLSRRPRSRCPLRRAAGEPPSPRSLTGLPPSSGPLSSAWAAARSVDSRVTEQWTRQQRPRRPWGPWRWRRGRSWWGSGSCAWRWAKRRGRSAGRAAAAGGAGERGSSERCHTGTAAIRTWR